MARRYVRDAKGRFAGKGFSGQTGGRGARLKSGKGNIREVAGQKRGERHILRSAETKTASRKSFDASVQSANITLPKKFGGQGMPRGSFMAQAASRRKAQAVAERDSALRKSGLPKSGGAMRVKGGIKRDPNAGQKLAATAKPAVVKAARTGNRIDAGAKANRAATRSVNKARSEARGAMFDAMNKNMSAPFSSPVRQKQNKRLNDANYEVDARIQTRRNIRAQFPVNRKTPTFKGQLPASTVKKPTSTKAQRSRASSDLARSLDSRGNARGRRNRATKRTAERAAEFYSNPVKALKGVRKEVAFRMPRGFRK